MERENWMWWLTAVLAMFLFVIASSAPARGQARTAERVLEVPFSQLRSTDPESSIRVVVNGSATIPCTVGSVRVLAVKLNGIWRCSDLAGPTSSAPTAATYITQIPHSTLTNEQALSLLSTGLVKSATGTGVLTIAVPGIDFLAINGSGSQLTNLNASNLSSGTVATARGGFGANVSAADGVPLFTAGVPAFTSTTGTGTFVRNSSPIILTPTIADFANSTHNHTNAAGGGLLTDAALSAAVGITKGGTGQTTATAGFNALDPLTTKGDLLSHDGTNSIRLAVGTNGQCVKANSAQTSGLEWGTCGAGTGDMVGPASSTDNAVVRFDGTTGKLVQNSGVTIDDSANVSTTGAVTSGSGSSVAGTVELGEGTAPALVANSFSIYAPTDVAAGGIGYVLPAAAASGVMRVTNSSGVMTITHDAGISHLAASTSADLAGVLSDETGSGGGFVRATSPSLTTPSLGAATATSINGLTITSSTGTLTIANGKTASVSNTLTFTGTDSSSVAFGAGGTVSYTIASGTSALGTSAIASGACATVVTTTATGTATTDVVGWGFNGDPTGVTGYAPSANGMLTIIAYPSANNVNFKVCNNLASSVTPGAITLNWRVVR